MMKTIDQSALRQRYLQAIDHFVERVKDDPNVIAVIVLGSVAYDVLGEKSDVDTVIIVRDQQIKSCNLCLVEDGIPINADLITRSEFKRGLERSMGGSFFQSLLANGMVVYSTDESLYDYIEEMKQIGESDRAVSALSFAAMLISILHKSQKWLRARRDPLYAQYYLLNAAEAVAAMELCIRGIPASRSTMQKALALNPEAVKPFYNDLLERRLTEDELEGKLQQLDDYIHSKMPIFQQPVLEYLADREVKTASMIAKLLHTESHMIYNVLLYMADKGVIEAVPQIIKLTPKSRLSVEEFAYLLVQ